MNCFPEKKKYSHISEKLVLIEIEFTIIFISSIRSYISLCFKG